MSIPHPRASVPYETLVREQQAPIKQLATRYTACSRLLPAFQPPASRLLPVFIRYRREHEHILQVSLQVYRPVTGRLQVGYRSVTGRLQVNRRYRLLHLPAESEV
jgi:hypothetical protein